MQDEQRNALKAFIAGVMGGLAGSFAMSQFYRLVLTPAETTGYQNKDDSTVLAASAISQFLFHRELTGQQKEIAGSAVHYAFGVSMSAVYAMAVEREPVLRSGSGISFGIVLWLCAHVITVPALGLSEPITRSTVPAEATELAAHLVYGGVAEAIRRVVRLHVPR